MNKIRLLSMIIGSAVFLAAIFVFQAFGAAGSAKENSSLAIVRGNYPLHEPHQSDPNVGAAEKSSSNAKTGGPQFVGLSVKNCFSAAYHSATDCDRLASAPYLVQVTEKSSNGPTIKNCISAAYHAASDCDRLASAQYLVPAKGNKSNGLTTKNCFSAENHAATDCDRLASENYFSGK